MTLIQAIARMEGWGVAGAIPTRDDNPGDICAGQFAEAHGAEDVPGRFAVFETAQDGFAALRALLVGHYTGLTVAQAVERYAPATENDTARYIADVCEWTGLTPETVLTAETIG
jgi:hypothetical protein